MLEDVGKSEPSSFRQIELISVSPISKTPIFIAIRQINPFPIEFYLMEATMSSCDENCELCYDLPADSNISSRPIENRCIVCKDGTFLEPSTNQFEIG